MPIAFVQEFDVDAGDSSTSNYDAVKAKLNVDADPPAGLIVHTAGFTGNGIFRTYDVWESKEDFERFRDERLMPAVQAVMGEGATGGPPARERIYQLHDVVKP